MKIRCMPTLFVYIVLLPSLCADTIKLEDLTERDREILSRVRSEELRQKALEELTKLRARNTDREKLSRVRALRSEMTQAGTAWIRSGSQADAETCDNAIDRLLAAEPSDVRSYFCAAQFAFIRGAYDKAISALEEVKLKDPDVLSPITNLPVKTVCSLWVATAHKYSGNMPAANATYLALQESADPNDLAGGLVTAICSLYLAEDAANPTQLCKRLDTIERLQVRHIGGASDPVALYKQWASYIRMRQTDGPAIAAADLPVPSVPAFYLAIGHLRACGLLPDDVSITSDQCRTMQDGLFTRVRDSQCSAVDKELFRTVLGYRDFSDQRYGDAETHFTAIIDADTFLSPFAGLWLAEANRRQGKYAEAEAMLKRVETSAVSSNSVS
jgi:tetratricopeptide (TPR) repeat protein